MQQGKGTREAGACLQDQVAIGLGDEEDSAVRGEQALVLHQPGVFAMPLAPNMGRSTHRHHRGGPCPPPPANAAAHTAACQAAAGGEPMAGDEARCARRLVRRRVRCSRATPSAALLTASRFWLAKRVPGEVGMYDVAGGRVLAGGAVDTGLMGTLGSSATCAAHSDATSEQLTQRAAQQQGLECRRAHHSWARQAGPQLTAHTVSRRQKPRVLGKRVWWCAPQLSASGAERHVYRRGLGWRRSG